MAIASRGYFVLAQLIKDRCACLTAARVAALPDVVALSTANRKATVASCALFLTAFDTCYWEFWNMKMSRVPLVAIILLAATALSCTVDPLPGRTQCEAQCIADSDCEPGLICFNDPSRGLICLPRDVAGCSGATPDPSYSFTKQDNGDMSCSFVKCNPHSICQRQCEADAICPATPALSICMTVCENIRQSRSACLSEYDASIECSLTRRVECSPIDGEATTTGCDSLASALSKCLAANGEF